METKKLKFGWCEQSIVPDGPISLAGQFFERVTSEVETPITVTAFAVDNGEDHAVFVACDLISIGENLIALARENLKGKVAGLDLNKVIISAIHTHTSFKYERADFGMANAKERLKPFFPKGSVYKPVANTGEGMDPKDALNFLADKIAVAVERAWNDRAEGYYETGFGRAVVGFNRRMKYDDGKAKLYGNVRIPNFIGMEGSTDNGIEMLFVFDKDKNITGVVLNVSCPSQVVEMKNFISSDYWGKVRILLREKFGEDLKILSLCGAAGDIAPRDMVRWRGKKEGYLIIYLKLASGHCLHHFKNIADLRILYITDSKERIPRCIRSNTKPDIEIILKGPYDFLEGSIADNMQPVSHHRHIIDLDFLDLKASGVIDCLLSGVQRDEVCTLGIVKVHGTFSQDSRHQRVLYQ